VVEVEPLAWLLVTEVSGLSTGLILKGQAILDEFFSDCLTSDCVIEMLLSLDFLILGMGPTCRPETSVTSYPRERLN
jgi:hypothetical protein